MICKRCGSEMINSNNIYACPMCGIICRTDTKEAAPKKKRNIAKIIGGTLLVLFAVAAFGSLIIDDIFFGGTATAPRSIPKYSVLGTSVSKNTERLLIYNPEQYKSSNDRDDLIDDPSKYGYTVVSITEGLSYAQLDELVSTLENFDKLESLCIEYAGLWDISPLSRLTRLTHLNLDRNNVVDISALESLQKLEYLSLAGNKIKNTDSLSSLKKLKNLDIRYNELNLLEQVSIRSKIPSNCVVNV